jgi:ABC-type transporter Mla subunit MlaD
MAMSTPAHDQADIVTRLMLQITQHAERLALLDQHETGHYGELTRRWDDLAQQLAEIVGRVDAVHDLAARQTALLETLDGLDQHVAPLTTRLNQMTAATKPDEGGIRQPV